MPQGQFCECKECGGKYTLIHDDEDPRLTMFDKPLPCFSCGIGWCSFLLGFLCPIIWYCAATLYLCKYYNRDPRERAGLAAAAIAAQVLIHLVWINLCAPLLQAVVCTVVVLLVLAIAFL